MKKNGLFISLGLLWGIGFTINKYVMAHHVDVLAYSFWLALGPACCLFLAAYSCRYPIKIDFSEWRYYGCIALLGIVIPNTNMYFVAAHLPVGLMAVVINTAPLFLYPMALFFFRERYSFVRNIGFLLGVFGILLLAWPRVNLLTVSTLPWLFLGLLSPLCYAYSSIYIAKNSHKNISALSLSVGMLLASSILLLLVNAPHATRMLLLFRQTHELQGLIVLQIILSSLGYVLLFKFLQIANPIYMILANGLAIMIGICLGKFVFFEPISLLSTLVCILVLVGIFLVSCSEKYRLKNKG